MHVVNNTLLSMLELNQETAHFVSSASALVTNVITETVSHQLSSHFLQVILCSSHLKIFYVTVAYLMTVFFFLSFG